MSFQRILNLIYPRQEKITTTSTKRRLVLARVQGDLEYAIL